MQFQLSDSLGAQLLKSWQSKNGSNGTNSEQIEQSIRYMIERCEESEQQRLQMLQQEEKAGEKYETLHDTFQRLQYAFGCSESYTAEQARRIRNLSEENERKQKQIAAMEANLNNVYLNYLGSISQCNAIATKFEELDRQHQRLLTKLETPVNIPPIVPAQVDVNADDAEKDRLIKNLQNEIRSVFVSLDGLHKYELNNIEI